MAYATVHRGDYVKIAVYAISKNEEKFVERWVNSMNEADEIYVADTGSTDNTVELLKQKGVIVNSVKIEPWRFDDAPTLTRCSQKVGEKSWKKNGQTTQQTQDTTIFGVLMKTENRKHHFILKKSIRGITSNGYILYTKFCNTQSNNSKNI